MTLYITNNKYHFKSLDNAIEKAKEIVRHYNRITEEEWKITQGKHGGYCVKLIGADYHNQIIIKTVETED